MLLTFCWVKVLLHKCSVLETIYLVVLRDCYIYAFDFKWFER